MSAQSAPSTPHLLVPVGLRCDGKVDPLAIIESEPLFSWQLSSASSALHGVSQSAYQIEVGAADLGFKSEKAILWDSGIVHGSRTFGIPYSGPVPEAQRAYAWRVRVWDERGHPTGWSAIAHWSQAPIWRAHWIAAHATGAEADEAPLPLFRKSFSLGHPIAHAILYAAGLGQDELRLNGRKVSDDVLTPGWTDYRKTVDYDSFNVTALLQRGQNVLGIMLGNGMYRVLHTPGRYTKFVGSFGPPQCIVQLDIEFAGGGAMEIASDASWKTLPGPITFSSTYSGEDYDARRDSQGWDRPGFDDVNWRPVVLTDGPGGELTPEISPPIRVMHTYTPVRITHPKPGIAVYDFGQNFAGWPAITVSGSAGATVKLIPGELLDKNGLVTQRSSGGPQWFSYTLRGVGIETWDPRFSYYGLRYVQVEGTSSRSSVHLISIHGDAIDSSSPQIGSFDSSNRLLNRVHMLILHAIENNTVSLFTDCPHREKLGWLEETHLMAPSLLDDFNLAGLYAATARNIADAQKANGPQAGMVPEIAPQYVQFPEKYDVFNDSPEWGSAAVLAPWYVYQRTGDRRFLGAQFLMMRRYVAYLATRAHNGIVDYGLGDWYDIGSGPPGFSQLTSPGVTATAIYYQDLQTMVNVSALLGLMAESESYARQAAQVRSSFNARFLDAASHRYDRGSQTAQAMPLALGIVPASQHAAVLDALIADIRAHHNHTTAGDVGFRYVVDALMDNGRSDVLLDMLERTDAPSYGYQLAHGATSLTEAWDANPRNSQDHFMLGDAEEWFYQGLGGIDVNLARDGAERIVLHPATLGRIAWVRAHYQSALGLIESDWSHQGAETIYRFTVPLNATATIELRTSSPRALTVNGVHPRNAQGVLSTASERNDLQIVVSSGHYEIRSANLAQNRQ